MLQSHIWRVCLNISKISHYIETVDIRNTHSAALTITASNSQYLTAHLDSFKIMLGTNFMSQVALRSSQKWLLSKPDKYASFAQVSVEMQAWLKECSSLCTLITVYQLDYERWLQWKYKLGYVWQRCSKLSF